MSGSIEIVAIETSGLDPKKEIVLEVAVARYVVGQGFLHGQSSPIDPGDFDLSEQILAFHEKTGLIKDLLEERIPVQKAAEWLKPANLRIVWALDFARPFLQSSGLKTALVSAIDARSIFELARVLVDSPEQRPNRAGDKVMAVVEALKAIEAPR